MDCQVVSPYAAVLPRPTTRATRTDPGPTLTDLTCRRRVETLTQGQIISYDKILYLGRSAALGSTVAKSEVLLLVIDAPTTRFPNGLRRRGVRPALFPPIAASLPTLRQWGRLINPMIALQFCRPLYLIPGSSKSKATFTPSSSSVLSRIIVTYNPLGLDPTSMIHDLICLTCFISTTSVGLSAALGSDIDFTYSLVPWCKWFHISQVILQAHLRAELDARLRLLNNAAFTVMRFDPNPLQHWGVNPIDSVLEFYAPHPTMGGVENHNSRNLIHDKDCAVFPSSSVDFFPGSAEGRGTPSARNS
ncbi:hypothetical protein EDB92DRAFT_2037330 [Lactarius akahatsu]|uniref:Uncharacterized protein n=1 Tax=Lactarius akahatsu TaxID=416441 RepID=A0AAD4L8L1_9AGAM|nr:hypothetical protein EDB92DRAFT_2037330 [Lactarius akahatsu]